MAKNDKRILELKQKIADKKKQIGDVKRFTPLTNCRYLNSNIRTLDESNLKEVLLSVQSQVLAEDSLPEVSDTTIGGFALADWKSDMLQLIKGKQQKVQLAELKQAEDKLTQLLSDDKQTELEIDDLESVLGL